MGKIEFNNIEWYIEWYGIYHITLHQAILCKQILSKVPTDFKKFHYVERSVFMKEIYTQTFWTFELGTQA